MERRSGKRAVTPGPLNISHEIKLPAADKGIKSVLHQN